MFVFFFKSRFTVSVTKVCSALNYPWPLPRRVCGTEKSHSRSWIQPQLLNCWELSLTTFKLQCTLNLDWKVNEIDKKFESLRGFYVTPTHSDDIFHTPYDGTQAKRVWKKKPTIN